MESLKSKLLDWKIFCQQNKIPIIRDLTADFITNLINENHFQNLLEIGTAYGYSAAYFALYSKIKTIITLEYNAENFLIAKSFLTPFGNIHPIYIDAFLYSPQNKFDIIFLDGPKSHQEKLISQYILFLKPNGFIVVDNIYLRKLRDLKQKSKAQVNLLKKLDYFITWALNNKNLECKIIDIDDGVMLIRNKEQSKC